MARIAGRALLRRAAPKVARAAAGVAARTVGKSISTALRKPLTAFTRWRVRLPRVSTSKTSILRRRGAVSRAQKSPTKTSARQATKGKTTGSRGSLAGRSTTTRRTVRRSTGRSTSPAPAASRAQRIMRAVSAAGTVAFTGWAGLQLARELTRDEAPSPPPAPAPTPAPAPQPPPSPASPGGAGVSTTSDEPAPQAPPAPPAPPGIPPGLSQMLKEWGVPLAGLVGGAALVSQLPKVVGGGKMVDLGLPDLGVPGPGIFRSPFEQAAQAQPVKVWTANGVLFARMADGKICAQRKDGTIKCWKPFKPTVFGKRPDPYKLAKVAKKHRKAYQELKKLFEKRSGCRCRRR